MKVIFLDKQNERLQNIVEALDFEVLIAENEVTDFIEEWQEDSTVKVLKTAEFKQQASSKVDHICKGLDLYVDAYQYIANNVTQNEMNDLTFSDVEYVKGLKNKPILWETRNINIIGEVK